MVWFLCKNKDIYPYLLKCVLGNVIFRYDFGIAVCYFLKPWNVSLIISSYFHRAINGGHHGGHGNHGNHWKLNITKNKQINEILYI